jgi:general secretion pathway protein J
MTARPIAKATKRARSGMTMVEVMVAMAILSIVASTLYTSFAQTARIKVRVEASLDREHEIRSGIERIAQELATSYTSAQRNINETLRTMITGFIAKEEGSNTRVSFTSFSHRRLYRNAHESDQNEIAYFITQDPEESGQDVLARREQRRVDDDLDKGGQSQILITNVTKFELSFYDPLTQEWSATWDTTQSMAQPNRLPLQAKINVTVPNLTGRGPDQTFGTRTFFPITYALNFSLYRP